MVSRRFSHMVRMSLAWPKLLKRSLPGKAAGGPVKVKPLPGFSVPDPRRVRPVDVARNEFLYQEALALWRRQKQPRQEVFERWVDGKLTVRRVKILPPKPQKQALRLLISLALWRKKMKRLRPDLYPPVG